jgi:hypothetical protein
MSIMKKVFCIILSMIVSFGAVIVCTASDNGELPNDNALLLVIDKSKESYGSQLQNDVYTQLEKQLHVIVLKESDVKDRIKNDNCKEISQLEQPELLELASKAGVKFVLVVEIMPTKSDFKEILFYQAIKSEATLKVRLYDAIKKRYVLVEEMASTGINKTMFPYTFVGKKKTVLEAVHRTTSIVVEKVNCSLDNSR